MFYKNSGQRHEFMNSPRRAEWEGYKTRKELKNIKIIKEKERTESAFKTVINVGTISSHCSGDRVRRIHEDVWPAIVTGGTAGW